MFGGLIERVAALQDDFVEADVALMWGDESNGAVSMLKVVPKHELFNPGFGLGDVGKGFDGQVRAIFEGSEQRFDEGVVVAACGA